MEEVEQTDAVRPGKEATSLQDIQMRLHLLDLAARVTVGKSHLDTLVAAKEFEIYVKGTAQ